MKVRTRSSKKVKERTNVWPSFVDIMSTVSLVFLFIMMFSLAMFIQIKEKTDNISEQRDKLYKKIEQELKPTLGDDVVYEDGILQIKSSLLFNTDSSELSEKGKKVAKKLGDAFIEVLDDEDNRKKIESIKVVGHTDNDSNGQYNRTLSTERAVSFVNQMLGDKEKDSDYGAYFEASGMSKYCPQEGNIDSQTEKQKDKNRRIEVKIVFSDDDIAKFIRDTLNK